MAFCHCFGAGLCSCDVRRVTYYEQIACGPLFTIFAMTRNGPIVERRGGGAGTIPTATIPTSVIIVGLLSAYWRSPAPRSTCGTGRVRVRVSDTGACRNGECRNGACRNSACQPGCLICVSM